MTPAPRPHVLREWEPTRRFEADGLLRLAGAGALGTGPGTGTGTSGRKWLSQADLATGGPIIRELDRWGDLAGTRTGDDGWHLRACPWDHEHTVPGDNRAAVWAGGAFKCWHGHCAARNRSDFLDWFNRKLDDESGGLFSDAAQLDMEPIDPASVPVPGPTGTIAAPSAKKDKKALTAAELAILAEMIWVRDQGKFFSRRTQLLEAQRSVDFHWSGPLGRAKVCEWLARQRGRVTVDSLVYWPGGGEVVALGAATCANRWRPCVLGQVLAGGPPIANWMIRPWLALVWHVLGNEGPRFVVRVLDMMALIVAEPGLKPGWHLIVQGAQGIGKDLLMLPVVFAVGAGNVGMVSAAGLHRDHNPWAEKRLVLVSELKQTSLGSASGRDQYNTLKALTENTSETIPINEKNVKLYHARNVGAYYVTSNEPDALALDADDRRFAVAASTAVKWPGHAYAHLVSWLGGASGHGSETVAGWLRQRWARMPAWRKAALLGNAFDTASKHEMVDAADPVRAWTREQIEDGVWPDLMTSAEIDERYRLAVRGRVFKFAVPSGRWGRLVRELGGGKVYGGAPVRLSDGRQTRVWAVRGVERFAGMGEPQIARVHKRGTAQLSDFNADVVVFPGSATPATDET